MISKLRPRLSRWLENELTVWRLLVLTLLLAALTSIAMGLPGAVRGLDTELLLPLALLGALSGWFLAALPWPGWRAGAIIAGAGGFIILGRVGRLGEALLAALGQVWRWAWPGSNESQAENLQSAFRELGAGVVTLLRRLGEWSAGLVAGEPTFEPVATALVWGLALWLASAWAGWTVRRRDQALLGLLPAGGLLVMSMAYGGGSFAFLLLLLGLGWLLTALVGHTARERRWQAAGIDFALDIRLDLAVVVVWLTVGLVALAQIAPLVSAQAIAETTQRLIWGQPLGAGPLARSLGLEPPPGQPTTFDKARLGGLPRRHLLGAGPELSQQAVLRVQPAGPENKSYYYWRSLTYDRYTGAGWITGKTETLAYEAGAPLVSPGFEVSAIATGLTTQHIQTETDLGGLLHAPGALVSVDQPYQVAWRRADDMFGATVAATAYQVTATIPLADETRLRQAGSHYPAPVRQRYLALPPDVPGRVLTLARDLTATQPTPYDRAKAIEHYLRALPYDLNLPAPPRNRDVVDYFLFDLQRGYCDYYASAMVVLARAAGLPARLVVGYAGGSFDPAQGNYRVSEADAHAWAEIYFPDYGWIEFEPTAARPLRDQPGEPLLPATAETDLPALRVGPTGWSWRWGWGLLAGLAGLGLIGAVWAVADTWRLRAMTPAATVARLYRRLQDYGPHLAVPAAPGATPYEFSQALLGRITALTRGWGATLLTPAGPEIEHLTRLYVGALFSGQAPTPAEQDQVLQLWRRLRWRLGLAYIWLKLGKIVSDFGWQL